MKPFLPIVLVVLYLLPAVPARAQHHDEHTCPHHGTDVASLRACVEHASAHGFIDRAGITQSLLAKLTSAQGAVERGQKKAAINILEAFVREVEAQAGKHIQEVHASHLVEHAQHIIQALSP